jgi:2-polyprenyl-3-methyl-5-hydroxy-6-metoxy-1,4-benzoquinol methylase
MSTTQKEIANFYNTTWLKRQVATGINDRHKSIFCKALSIGMLPNSHVLEVGCGIGTLTQLLIEYLSEGSLYSCDISNESIAIAKENLKKYNNLTLQCQDATDFLLDKKFDLIIMPDCIEHIPIELHKKMFLNLSKMLKKNGILYIHIPNPYCMEWYRKYKKDQCQIIDQSVYVQDFVKNIEGTELYLAHEESYSLWLSSAEVFGMGGGEYTHRICKKEPKILEKTYTIIPVPNLSLLQKIKRKLTLVFTRK